MNLPENVNNKVIISFNNYSFMTFKEVNKEIKQFYQSMKRTNNIKEVKSQSIM